MTAHHSVQNRQPFGIFCVAPTLLPPVTAREHPQSASQILETPLLPTDPPLLLALARITHFILGMCSSDGTVKACEDLKVMYF